ncbi:MAG: CBS domain-containing protein, partial [Actinomycetota bacterium]
MYDTKVKDVMTSLVVSLRPDESIHDAASRLARNRISGGPVLKDGKVVGVVSEADLIRAVMPPVPVDSGSSALDALGLLFRAKPITPGHGKTVGDVMNPAVVTIGSEESIWAAATVMDHRGIKRLPVVDHEGYLL